MSDATKSDNTSESYDAQQAIEEIEGGDRKAPDANVEADYEASKQFSTSAIDKADEGAEAAEAATSSDFKLPERDESLVSSSDSSGNPDDYKQMANELGSTPAGESSANADSLYQKAVEKGKAGA